MTICVHVGEGVHTDPWMLTFHPPRPHSVRTLATTEHVYKLMLHWQKQLKLTWFTLTFVACAIMHAVITPTMLPTWYGDVWFEYTHIHTHVHEWAGSPGGWSTGGLVPTWRPPGMPAVPGLTTATHTCIHCSVNRQPPFSHNYSFCCCLHGTNVCKLGNLYYRLNQCITLLLRQSYLEQGIIWILVNQLSLQINVYS